MLEKSAKNYKKICYSSLGQLFFLLAMCARSKYTNAFAQSYQESNIMAYSPKNDILTDNCKRYNNTDCYRYHFDEYCFSVMYTNLWPNLEDYDKEGDYIDSFTIKCKAQPQDITRLFNTSPKPAQYKSAVFHVQNIFDLPIKLFDENVSFPSAELEYVTNTDKIINVLNHLPNLQKLYVRIKSYIADEKWLSAFLRPQKALKYLRLELFTNGTDVVLPLGSFSTLSDLQALDVSIYQRFNFFPEDMPAASLRNLRRDHFRNLTKLKRLYLRSNQIQTLEPDLFSVLQELNVLMLDSNLLRNLAPKLFAAQSKLVSLNLSYNHLKYLPTDLFTHTPLLSTLMLRSNNLHDIGNVLATLKPLNYLVFLDLSKNKFESIVHGNNNLLTHINLRSYENVPHEKPILDLSFNNLMNFTWDDRAACNTKISLSNNRIRYFHALTLPTAVTPTCVRHLYLHENSLHCGCQLVWVYYLYFLPASTIRTDTTSLICASPSNLFGRSLSTLQLGDVCERPANICPPKCKCARAYGDDGSAALVVNCNSTHIDATLRNLPRSEEVSAAQTTIYIERCNLTELPLSLINGYANVTRLYAAENNITTLSALHLPKTLLLLDLRANNLKRLSSDILNFLNESSHLQALYLSHNPWLCDCDVMQLVYTLRMHRARIPDIERLSCANRRGFALLNVDPVDICHVSDSENSALLMLLLFALLLLILTALYYKYKLEVKIWLYAHNLCVFWIEEEELDQNKSFDAFISYAHQQSEYISEVLLPGLEQGDPSFRICVHDRNWLAGTCIPDQIAKSVELSCRTIIVLSQDFIESKWARMEFRMAHQCALNEGRTRVIVIKYDELPNLERLDIELQAYLKTNTYLESNDPRFWPKLRYAMPHKNMENGEFYIPDEMELNDLCKRS